MVLLISCHSSHASGFAGCTLPLLGMIVGRQIKRFEYESSFKVDVKIKFLGCFRFL